MQGPARLKGCASPARGSAPPESAARPGPDSPAPQDQGRQGAAAHPIVHRHAGMAWARVPLRSRRGRCLAPDGCGRGRSRPDRTRSAPARPWAPRSRAGSCWRWARTRSCSANSCAVLVFPPVTIERPQPPQHGEALRGLPHLLTQRRSAGVGRLHLRALPGPW